MPSRVKWLLLVVGCVLSAAAAFVYLDQTQKGQEQPSSIPDSAQTSGKSWKEIEIAPDSEEPFVSNGQQTVSIRKTAGSGTGGSIGRVRDLASAPKAGVPFPELPRSAVTNRPARDPASRRGLYAWLDNLKETDPNQYKEVMARRDEARQKVQAEFAEKTAAFLFVDLDTASMTEEERQNYDKMLQLLGHAWQLSERLSADLTPDERQDLMRTLRQDVAALEPMLAAQRDREWTSFGLQLGYNPDEARAFADCIKKIYDLTSLRRGVPNIPPTGAGPPTDEQRQAYQQMQQKALAEKADYFLSQDTSSMTDQERQNYGQMLQLFDEARRATERLNADLPSEVRRDLRNLLRQDMAALGPMLTAQRDREWYNLGLQLGYNQEGAQSFAGYVNKVYDLTTLRGIYQNMRGGAPRGGAPGTGR